jgi:hypothetical protein
MPTDTAYRTPDLGQAAYIVVRGFPLVAIEGVARERRVFVFADGARAVADEFFAGGLVSAERYAAALRTVKAKLYGA